AWAREVVEAALRASTAVPRASASLAAEKPASALYLSAPPWSTLAGSAGGRGAATGGGGSVLGAATAIAASFDRHCSARSAASSAPSAFGKTRRKISYRSSAPR